MDSQTIEVYERFADKYAARYRGADPVRLREIILAHFRPGESTADIGSGSGRDVHWLQSQGFAATGYDASTNMIREAELHFPGLSFKFGRLPELIEIPDESFTNVLCSAVLMHLPRIELVNAVLNLARILRVGGRIVISYRRGEQLETREPDGRLFTPIHPGQFSLTLEAAGLQIIQREEVPDAMRSDVTWTTLVAEKETRGSTRGLDRVQSILAQDRKTTTYKLALIRSLCAVGRTQSHIIVWGDREVFVPLKPIAIWWLRFYWPIVASPRFIAQQRGERSDSETKIAFRRRIEYLIQQYGAGGLADILRKLDEGSSELQGELQTIAMTIRKGPITYSGGGQTPLFQYVSWNSRLPHDSVYEFGCVGVPESVWMDIVRFDHWIEDSVVLRWAQLTAEMDQRSLPGDVLPLLLAELDAERDTNEVRRTLQRYMGQNAIPTIECVWTGKPVKVLEIDHVVPFSVWGNNDLWNLLPAERQVNQAKRDRLPTVDLLLRRRHAIAKYWSMYHETLWGDRFGHQVAQALGGNPNSNNWQEEAFSGLLETIERLASTRGLARWTT